MDIAELVFNQRNGVFFVWKMGNGKTMTTFLRNRKNIALELQVENALADGRGRMWTLTGIGYWCLSPIQKGNIPPSVAGGTGLSFAINHVTTSLLRIKNLPDRELKSTELGMQEMREKWIPYICERLRKILWEDEKE